MAVIFVFLFLILSSFVPLVLVILFLVAIATTAAAGLLPTSHADVFYVSGSSRATQIYPHTRFFIPFAN